MELSMPSLMSSDRHERKPRSMLHTNAWLKNRERGTCQPEPSCSFYARRLYENIYPFARFDPTACPDRSQGHIRSGVFGLEFSSDGRVLGVAAENKSLSFFDPLRPPDPFLTVANAHRDCVNCVKFLDNRLLASCSDDHTIKLWDLRQMKT
uniref:Uncharacterized protein n=2 Tax=Plectus sambesii TaxID=2011161 RepID=A0A914XGZ7_9BILA